MPNGDFHFSDNEHHIYSLRGSLRPDRLYGFSSPTDPNLPSLSSWLFQFASWTGLATSTYKMSDLVGYERGGRTYGIFYRNRDTDTTSPDMIGVYRMNEAGNGMDAFRLFAIVWSPSTESPAERGTPTTGMGALWSFENKIIGHGGTGLYQIDVNSFDFDDAGSTTAQIYFLRSAVLVSVNDGVNCMLERQPWHPCPENSDAETPNPEDCKCNAGYTGPDGANGECTACLSGSYKDTQGDSHCIDCETGEYPSC